jgi:integrase
MTKTGLPGCANRQTAWTDEQIAAFEAKYPIDSIERSALALALYTAQRLTDITRLDCWHIRDDLLRIQQHHQNRTRVVIPLHPELARVLDANPNEDPTLMARKSSEAE